MASFTELRDQHFAYLEANIQQYPQLAERFGREMAYMAEMYGVDDSLTAEQVERRSQYVASHETAERRLSDPKIRAILEARLADLRRRDSEAQTHSPPSQHESR